MSDRDRDDMSGGGLHGAAVGDRTAERRGRRRLWTFVGLALVAVVAGLTVGLVGDSGASDLGSDGWALLIGLVAILVASLGVAFALGYRRLRRASLQERALRRDEDDQ